MGVRRALPEPDDGARSAAHVRATVDFHALLWMTRAGAPWRLLPNDFPPWEAVYQQAQRWLQSGCFETMISDLRSVLLVAHGKQG